MKNPLIASGMLFATLLLLLNSGCAGQRQARANASPERGAAARRTGGISDAAIRDIVERVARHNVQALAEGEYPAVTNLAGAESAAPPEGIAWDYPHGVMLYGMERSTAVTGDTNVGPFVVEDNLICVRYYQWLAGLEDQFGNAGKQFASKTKLGRLINLGNLDSCGAMGNELLVCMMRHPDLVTPGEQIVMGRIADWVTHRQDRLPDGTLWRSKELGGTVWPDDLYMGGVFLVRYGIYTHDEEYIEDAASNIIHQAALEQDTDGLWFHGYFVKQQEHAPFKWGRGDGWAMVATVETLSAMRDDDPLRPELLDILRKQIAGLKRVQAPDGMWRQVLDHPESWEETSCTAMFAYGIARAVNRGWIDPSNMEVARHAFAGIARNVTPDGAVLGTCEGTNIGMTLDFYLQRERPPDDPHGRGPVMLAGTEILLAGKSTN